MEKLIEYLFTHVPVAYAIVMFAFGAAAGSFLNVVIYRLPYRISLLSPPSTCPHCGQRIFGLDNLPIIGWFKVGGRCRQCRHPISWRYPAIEFLNASLWGWVAWTGAHRSMTEAGDYGHWNNIAVIIVGTLFISALVVVTFIDFDLQIIPDEISLGGLAVALVITTCFPDMIIHYHPELIRSFGAVPPWMQGLLCSLIGAVAGAGLLFLMCVGGTIAFRKQIRKAQEKDPEIDTAIGWGDVKLMGFIGAVIGWKGVLIGFVLGTIVGAVAGIVDKLRSGIWPGKKVDGALAALWHRWQTGNSVMPYGPFLSIGAVIYFFFREPVEHYFVNLLFPPMQKAVGVIDLFGIHL